MKNPFHPHRPSATASSAPARTAPSVRVPIDCDGVTAAVTVPHAHRLLQIHRECLTSRCAARAAALAVLQASGDYVVATVVPWP